MHGMTDLRLSKQRREQMLREVVSNRLKKVLRAKPKRPASSRLASVVAWELLWAGGLLREFFWTPNNED